MVYTRKQIRFPPWSRGASTNPENQEAGLKLSLGRVIAHLAGGGIGAFIGFYLPIFVVLLCERGHEAEQSLSRFDAFVGCDLLILMSGLSACVGACVSSWLLAAWIYPRGRSSLPMAADTPEESMWPPPPCV